MNVDNLGIPLKWKKLTKLGFDLALINQQYYRQACNILLSSSWAQIEIN